MIRNDPCISPLTTEERLLARFVVEDTPNMVLSAKLAIQYGQVTTEKLIPIRVETANQNVQPRTSKSGAGLFAQFCAQQIQRIEYVSDAYRLSSEDKLSVIGTVKFLSKFNSNSDWAKRGNILNRLTAFVGVAENQNKINYWTNTRHG